MRRALREDPTLGVGYWTDPAPEEPEPMYELPRTPRRSIFGYWRWRLRVWLIEFREWRAAKRWGRVMRGES